MSRGNGYDVLSVLKLFQFFHRGTQQCTLSVILNLHDLVLKMELKFSIKASVQGKHHIAVYQ